jgi:hypothetical protein
MLAEGAAVVINPPEHRAATTGRGDRLGHTRYVGPLERGDMDADGTPGEVDGTRRRFVAWYGEWYLTMYAVLAAAILLGAGYGYATGALSWWNAGGMVVTLAALSGFIWWRSGVDPAFEGE